jgi:hypothetical protein
MVKETLLDDQLNTKSKNKQHTLGVVPPRDPMFESSHDTFGILFFVTGAAKPHHQTKRLQVTELWGFASILSHTALPGL